MRGAALTTFLMLSACSAPARAPDASAVAPAPQRHAPVHLAPSPSSAIHGVDDLVTFTPPGVAVSLPVEGDRPYYDIEQQIDDGALAVLGTATLSFCNPSAAPLASVPLLLPVNTPVELGLPEADSSSLRITELRSLGGPATRFQVIRPTLVLVTFDRPLAPGERVQLAIRYVARLARYADDGAGSIEQALMSMEASSANKPVDLRLFGASPSSLTLASGYPMLAPYHHGAFDVGPPPLMGDVTYNQVATFRVRSTVPLGLHLVSNLTDARHVSDRAGRDVWISRGSAVRDVAFVLARDFREIRAQVGAVRVTSTYLADDAAAGKRALATAAASLASFERRYGQYPWPELHIVEAPLAPGVGGMEYCGMAIVAASLYHAASPGEGLLGLLGGALAGIGGEDAMGGSRALAQNMQNEMQGALEFTVAHEVAHQYFSGVVGNDSRTDACVDEPLAQFAAAQAVEDLRGPAAGASALERYGKMNYAMYRLTGGADRPALRPTSGFSSSLEYAALVYGKAPFAYVALRQQLGGDRLSAAIRAAIAKHRFGIATTREWMQALAVASPRVLPVLQRYWEEARGDQDLQVDGSGEFLLATLLPKGAAASLRASLRNLGLSPKDLLQLGQSLRGGGLEGGHGVLADPPDEPSP